MEKGVPIGRLKSLEFIGQLSDLVHTETVDCRGGSRRGSAHSVQARKK